MKNVVITGCNRGLGSGIRNVFTSNGNYHVYGINRTKTSETIENYSEISCDVSSSNEVDAIVENLPENIDLLVINAGIRRFSEVENMTLEDWNDSVATNLNGAFYILRKLIPAVKKCKGDIIIVGSHSEKYTFEGGAAYCSTKGALKELAGCLMDELRYDDVRVTYLSLGSIKNRDHGYDESWKLIPEEVGQAIYDFSTLPKNVLIPYADIRPLKPLKDSKSGMDRLQYV